MRAKLVSLLATARHVNVWGLRANEELFFSGQMRSEHEADYPSPSIEEINKTWIPAVPHTCSWHGAFYAQEQFQTFACFWIVTYSPCIVLPSYWAVWNWESSTETESLNNSWLKWLITRTRACSEWHKRATLQGGRSAVKLICELSSIYIKPRCTRSTENVGHVTNHVTRITALLLSWKTALNWTMFMRLFGRNEEHSTEWK
jgi:hypothetical protein